MVCTAEGLSLLSRQWVVNCQQFLVLNHPISRSMIEDMLHPMCTKSGVPPVNNVGLYPNEP